MSNEKVQEEVIHSIPDICGNKVIGLPGDRMFTIGGSRDINGKDTVKDCIEITDKQRVVRANMFTPRSNFGCAIYPNFT
jgi:hypothetical protein